MVVDCGECARILQLSPRNGVNQRSGPENRLSIQVAAIGTDPYTASGRHRLIHVIIADLYKKQINRGSVEKRISL